MTKNNNTSVSLGWVIAIIAVVGLYGLYLYNRPKHDWDVNYKNKSKEPYGVDFVEKLLQTYHKGQKFTALTKPLPQSLPKNTTNANYVFIGNMPYLDSSDVKALYEFVNKGNTVFMALDDLPYTMMDFGEQVEKDSAEPAAYASTYSYFLVKSYDTTLYLNFQNEQLRTRLPTEYRFFDGKHYEQYSWSYISNMPEKAILLGEDNSQPNFIRTAIGKGQFILHSSPIAFSNYFIHDSLKLQYAEKVLSHLNPEGAILWDSIGHNYKNIYQKQAGNRGNPNFNNEGPLRFILSQRALAWAWYIFLGMVGCYLLFVAKRKQRIIPIRQGKSNTSLGFIQTIGRMYFLKNDYQKLSVQMIRQWKTNLRERYRLQERHFQQEEDFLNAIAQKSGLPTEQIRKIMSLEKTVTSIKGSYSEETMIELHRYLENFYRSAK